jgi:hypothetical protein
VKHRIAASTMTTLTIAAGTLGVAALSATPASAASCSTMTVTDSGLLGALTVSISPVALTVNKGGCVDFSIKTDHPATVSVDGSTVGSEWSASSAGAHVVSATVTGSGLLKVSKLGAATITVTSPPPTKAPVPTPNPSNPTGGGGGGTGGGGGGGTGGGSGGGAGGGTGGGGSGGGHASGGGGGGTSRTGGHSGGGLLGSGGGHRGSGVGESGTGGLLSSGDGFSLPSIPLGTFSREGLAGMTNGTSPQLAPQIGATDAAGNPLPLVSGGTQRLSLAGDSRSSGQSPIPPIVAGLLILATAVGLFRAVTGRAAARRKAVDGRHALRARRA